MENNNTIDNNTDNNLLKESKSDTTLSSIETTKSSKNIKQDEKLLKETKLLRDTLDLLWNKSLEQHKICDDLQRENEHLQDYINNLMSSSNVLEK
ncbi:Slo1p PWA37_004933 [Arxiozyma heterogenica]|uniref:Uncharacterized protein n=1 Tax=Arxiozyma heterogenica TaxID=278026 RepID=A0AAN7ZWR6_9SACH|nr:hypothetical protein RI543_004964 [Kazachstania heterogenica]